MLAWLQTGSPSQQLVIATCCLVISILIHLPVVYFYDCLLTFPEEVSEIWPSRWSLTKIAYLTSRYSGLAYFVLNVISNFLVTDSDLASLSLSCLPWLTLHQTWVDSMLRGQGITTRDRCQILAISSYIVDVISDIGISIKCSSIPRHFSDVI